jgi:hypothetical protein
MSLTWGGIKRLVRLQAVAEELADIAGHGQNLEMSRDSVGRLKVILDEVIDEAHDVLRDADPGLAEEFERIVIEGTASAARLSLDLRASILAGWLNGMVEAETLEFRIRMGDDRQRRGKLVSNAGIGD